MAQYRIVKTNKDTYLVQEKITLFFWTIWETKGREGPEHSHSTFYEFSSVEEARQYIGELKKWGQENEAYKIIEYH
jgi:hypothetical protein